jgi:hypothetical protein
VNDRGIFSFGHGALPLPGSESFPFALQKIDVFHGPFHGFSNVFGAGLSGRNFHRCKVNSNLKAGTENMKVGRIMIVGIDPDIGIAELFDPGHNVPMISIFSATISHRQSKSATFAQTAYFPPVKNLSSTPP